MLLNKCNFAECSFKKINCILYVWVFTCMYIYGPILCLMCRDLEVGIRSSGTGVAEGCELSQGN